MYTSKRGITPGRVRNVLLDFKPNLARNYRSIGSNVYLDSNFIESGGVTKLFANRTEGEPLYLTSKIDEPINGRSWEMSVAMALSGKPGVFTGVISEADNDTITFGKISGLRQKRDVDATVMTSNDIPFIKR